ncbi:MAG: ribonuclease PH [Deltaproteobacteria bacterium]|nr:ribonuclease PH [Deltaproteobacteria bacterium]
MARASGRSPHEHRPIELVPSFQRSAEGSVLYRAGGTVVLCTASVEDALPKWLAGRPQGWLTAEYQMHPRASAQARQPREGRGGQIVKGRTSEIQRLVGRALRAAVDLRVLGQRTITIDCDVLEADGGTRTASASGGWVALVLALHALAARGLLRTRPLCHQIAAISVGLVGDELCVDLDYAEDSKARLDMNVVATAAGELVDVQATAEGAPVSRESFDALLGAALEALGQVAAAQRRCLEQAGVDLGALAAAGASLGPGAGR